MPLWMVCTGLPKHRKQEKGVTLGIRVPGRFLREEAFDHLFDWKGLVGEDEQGTSWSRRQTWQRAIMWRRGSLSW